MMNTKSNYMDSVHKLLQIEVIFSK